MESCDSVLEAFPLLGPRLNSRAGNLSGGEQQAAAIGRALMTNPTLLLLKRTGLIARSRPNRGRGGVSLTQGELIEGGATIVLVEQDIGRALGVATHVACMLEGRIVLEGRAKDINIEKGRRRPILA